MWRAVKTNPAPDITTQRKQEQVIRPETRQYPPSQERHQAPQEEAYLVADGSPRSRNGPKRPGTAPSISPLDHNPPSPRDTEPLCRVAARRAIS